MSDKRQEAKWTAICIIVVVSILFVAFPVRWYLESHFWDKAYRYCMQMGDMEFGHAENERCMDYLKIGRTTEEAEKAELELLKQRALSSDFDL